MSCIRSPRGPIRRRARFASWRASCAIEALEPRLHLTISPVHHVAELDTNFGQILIELDTQNTPITVANFQQYADASLYDGTVIHRSTHAVMSSNGITGITVIQGGGYSFDGQAFSHLDTFGTFTGSDSDTLTFAADGTDAGSITRSSGSFVTEGFAAGQFVTIEQTANNNLHGKIASVTDSIITLTETDSAMVSETIDDSSNVTISAGIQNEFAPSRPNIAGTIAMAKTSYPNSATSEWFFNVTDNPELDNPDPVHNSGGYTVFGTVIAGMQVVNAISALSVSNFTDRFGPAFASLPLTANSGLVQVTSASVYDFVTVTIGQRGEGDRSVVFTDSDGTTSTIAFQGGSALLTFKAPLTLKDQPSNLSAASSDGQVMLNGTEVELAELQTQGTSPFSRLLISTGGGDGLVQLGALNVRGTLSSIAAPDLRLQGPLTTRGPVHFIAPSNNTVNDHETVPTTAFLRGGVASYSFLADDNSITLTRRGGTTIVRGTVNGVPAVEWSSLSTTGTTPASSLKVTTARGRFVKLSNLFVAGPLAAVRAPGLDMLGNFTATGSVRRIELLGINGGTLTVGSTRGGARSLTLESSINSESSIDSALPIQRLTAGSWENNDNVADTIQAPSMRVMKVFGSFGADLNLTNSRAKAQILRTNRLTGGTWTIAGSVNHMLFGPVAAGFSAEVTGKINTLSSGDLRGDWTFGKLRLGLLSSVTDASLTSTAAFHPGVLSIGKIKVGGLMNNATIRANGNIGSIRALAMYGGTHIYAGLKSSIIDSIPAQDTDYENPASIGSIVLRRPRLSTAVTASFHDTVVAAWRIGKIVAPTIDLVAAVGSTPFGIGADRIGIIRARSTDHQNLNFSNLNIPERFEAIVQGRNLNLHDFQILLV